jgi:hypothetical protein
MSEPKPVAMWARIAAGFIVGISVIGGVGTGWVHWRDRTPPNVPWYELVILAYSAWTIVPLFLSVALTGSGSWGGRGRHRAK